MATGTRGPAPPPGAAPPPQAATQAASNKQAVTPKKCLDDFFEHIDETVRKQAKFRGNAVQSVDWAKMAVQLAAASPKPRTPILTSSRTWRTDLAVDMKPEVKQQLRECFIRYCSWGDKVSGRTSMFISKAQFIHFARDMGLCNDTLDVFALTTLFDKILCGSLDPGAGARLGMMDFLIAITALAMRLYPNRTVQESFDAMMTKHILPRAAHPLPEAEPVDLVVLQQEVLMVLERVRCKVMVIWDHYMEVQQKQAVQQAKEAAAAAAAAATAPGTGTGTGTVGHSGHHSPSYDAPGHGSGGAAAGAAADVLLARSGMALVTFQRFCSEFSIAVNLLTKVQVAQAFKRAKFGVGEDGVPLGHSPNARLSFSELLDCLARCSLLAYDYKIPEVPIPTLDFKNSYQTAAKQMWLREAAGGSGLQGSGDDESELEMPAAMAMNGIGNEDRPHYDEVMSRAPSIRIRGGAHGEGLISRAVSIAQGRTRMSGPGGMEMMLIHPEPTQMEQDPKPLHLQQFTCEWVGRPGLPLSETGRLRLRGGDPWVATGSYSPNAGADPKYEHRMQDMVDARRTREQHVAMLQLQYQAERRQEIRDAARRAAERRSELEAASGQAVARLAPMYGNGSGQQGPGEAAQGSLEGALRSGSAPPRGQGGRGMRGSNGLGGSVNVTPKHGAADAVTRTGTRLPGVGRATGAKTLVQELREALDVDSKLPAGHGASLPGGARVSLRFG